LMNSRRLMGAYPKAKDHERIIAPCIAAKSGHSSPVRLKTGKSRSEQMFSGLPPKADL
jgi:hypothetical protein